MEQYKKECLVTTDVIEFEALTRLERVLLSQYRRLTERDQRSVRQLLEGMARIAEMES
ncbi:TPA: hypothetical protein SL829_002141 [Pseudomonas aeruginosa]|uniref:hypothetical protein n=1 Tax=Pseudomonas aeruginosa TaxID=287 RepID=UPI0029D8E5D4|nr:hypothetical protein [Pseudomonas aeruginosa]HEJ6164812.1 hypothetical protein [Pseudomonas aeruginosa]